MEKIGFVGTGAMGSALLARLKLANVQATAFDIVPRAMEAARAEASTSLAWTPHAKLAVSPIVTGRFGVKPKTRQTHCPRSASAVSSSLPELTKRRWALRAALMRYGIGVFIICTAWAARLPRTHDRQSSTR